MTDIRVPKAIGSGSPLVRRSVRVAVGRGRFPAMSTADAAPSSVSSRRVRRLRPVLGLRRALTAAVLVVLAPMALWASACVPAQPSTDGTAAEAVAAREPATPREVVEEMRLRWESRWPRTLEARLETTFYGRGAEQRQRWTQFYRVPGALRVEYEPRAAGNGLLYLNGEVHAFQNGQSTARARQRDALLLAGFDIHVQPVDSSLAALAALGIDTAAVHRTAVDGVLSYVIGTATPGDSTVPQLWVEADRWLARRVIESRAVGDGRILSEMRIVDRRLVDSIPLPSEVLRLRDGRPALREVWSEARAGVPLNDALFDPARWSAAVPPADA